MALTGPARTLLTSEKLEGLLHDIVGRHLRQLLDALGQDLVNLEE